MTAREVLREMLVQHNIDCADEMLALFDAIHADGAEAANAKLRRLAEIDVALNSENIHRESARDLIREKNQILHGSPYLPDSQYSSSDERCSFFPEPVAVEVLKWPDIS